MSKLKLIARCVDLSMRDVPDLHAMTEAARSVSFATFAKHCDWQDVARALGYAIGAERGLHMKADYCVSWYRSTWRGKPCYYMDHSRIEHIFQ